MAKITNKNNKERCKRYEQQGRRERNKVLKQERDKKRIARFARRKEEGKGVWAKEKASTPSEDRLPNVSEKEFIKEFSEDHRLPYARETSIFRKLDNMISAEELRQKRHEAKVKNATKRRNNEED